MKTSKMFNYDDLRTGMVIELDRGEHSKFARVLRFTSYNDGNRGDIMQYVGGHGGYDRLDYLLTGDLISRIVRVFEPGVYSRPYGNTFDSSMILVWERKKVHTIRLDDGAPIELSDETYENMKRSFKFE